MEQLKLIVADDHPMFRGALKQALEGLSPKLAVIEAGDYEHVVLMAREHDDADLILLDLAMPGSNRFTGLIGLRAEFPALPVMIISATEDAGTIARAIALGASGFVPKSSTADQIRDSVSKVLEGEIAVPGDFDLKAAPAPETVDLVNRFNSLTPQQAKVLSMLGEGLLNKQIAYELGVSEATVKAHVSAVLLKMRVDSRTQAVILLAKINAEPEG